jgi:type I restriction enzyme, S subunit
MNMVRLGDVVKIFKGKKVELYSGSDIHGVYRYIQIGDLRNDNNIKFTISNGVHVEEKDVVIAWDGANAGTIGYGLNGIIGSTLAKIEIQNNQLLGEYLGRFLESKFQYLRGKCTGTTIPHISRSVLLDLEVPFPSCEDQKSVVSILDQADALRKKRHKAIVLLDDYLRAVFMDMFGDPVINPKGLKCMLLSQCADIRSGVTKGRKFGDKETVKIPYMRVANVQDQYIDFREIKKIEVLPSDVEKYKLQMGDLLLTEGGDPDKLGRGSIWRGQIENCIHQNHIFRVRLNPDYLLPEFISAQISSSYGKRYFLRSAKQTTGIATINITQLKDFPVLVPDFLSQKKYSEVVARVRMAKLKMNDQFESIDFFFQALIQKAFKGELV